MPSPRCGGLAMRLLGTGPRPRSDRHPTRVGADRQPEDLGEHRSRQIACESAERPATSRTHGDTDFSVQQQRTKCDDPAKPPASPTLQIMEQRLRL